MSDPARRAQWLSLIAAILGISLIWIVVLPRLESHAMIRSRIEHLEQHGIDPAALFYTDLDSMPEWEADIRAAEARNPGAFWRIGTTRKD